MSKIIAKRVPPGDRWKLVDQDKIYGSLIEVLESYVTQKGYKGDFVLSPLKGTISIPTEEKPQPPKQYSIYGEFGQ